MPLTGIAITSVNECTASYVIAGMLRSSGRRSTELRFEIGYENSTEIYGAKKFNFDAMPIELPCTNCELR